MVVNMSATQMQATPQLSSVISERLGVLRTGDARSQKEIAEEMGVPLMVLNRAIRGESTPAADALIKIAAFYGVTIDWLLGVPGAARRRKPAVSKAQ